MSLLNAGNAVEALRVFSAKILPLIHLFGPGDEIPVTKAVFHQMGIFRSDALRLPLVPCTPERLAQVMLAYEVCEAGAPVAGLK